MLFLGPPGVGKSHLAAALRVKAIKNGFFVTHFILDDLMHALRADAAVPPARLRDEAARGERLDLAPVDAGQSRTCLFEVSTMLPRS